MSRAGNKPIKINEGIKVTIEDGLVSVSSEKGKQRVKILKEIVVEKKTDGILVTRTSDTPEFRAKHGLVARLIKNAISDLTEGVSKDLEFVGTGYKARTEGDKLVLSMGYSHDVVLQIPNGITVEIKKNTIHINGFDRTLVGEFAANVRGVRPPEVYKGKGIRYSTELVKRKAGKAAQAVGKE